MYNLPITSISTVFFYSILLFSCISWIIMTTLSWADLSPATIIIDMKLHNIQVRYTYSANLFISRAVLSNPYNGERTLQCYEIPLSIQSAGLTPYITSRLTPCSTSNSLFLEHMKIHILYPCSIRAFHKITTVDTKACQQIIFLFHPKWYPVEISSPQMRETSHPFLISVNC